jgi:hypothetical protein
MQFHDLYRFAAGGALGGESGWTAAMVGGAGKFYMGDIDHLPDELTRFGDDMRDKGLLRLPFGRTIFEYRTSGQIGIYWVPCEKSEVVEPPINFIAAWLVIRDRDGKIFELSRFLRPVKEFAGRAAPTVMLCPRPTGILVPRERDDVSEEWKRALENFRQMTLRLVMGGIVALISKSCAIDKVEAPEKLNRQRALRGKPPIFEYHAVTIGQPTQPATTNGGHHASPRMHWRRGHYRHWPAGSDHLIPVAPALVGAAERGFVDKDYIVRLGREGSTT